MKIICIRKIELDINAEIAQVRNLALMVIKAANEPSDQYDADFLRNLIADWNTHARRLHRLASERARHTRTTTHTA